MGNFRDLVEEELLVLEKALTYADRYTTKHFEDFDKVADFVESWGLGTRAGAEVHKIRTNISSSYDEFMRVAWGKAIRIQSSKKGEQVYRLSASSAVIPLANMATPNSPVGKLVNIARPGDEYYSEAFGDYTVEDVWFFTRYSGFEFVEQLKNFRSFISDGKNKYSIYDVRDWLHRSEVLEHLDEFGELDEIDRWAEIEFEKSQASHVSSITSDSQYKEDCGISLPSTFYINLSSEQYDAAHFGQSGLVLVTGVAGSGKTSVALARSKSLAQLGQIPSNDQNFNNDFSEETQLGIVKTGELIKYLKSTCEAMSLFRLPVTEYREVVEELKIHWDLNFTNSPVNKVRKFKLLDPEPKAFLSEYSSLAFFDVVSKEMAKVYVSKILLDVAKVSSRKVSDLDGDILGKMSEEIISKVQPILNKPDWTVGLLSKLNSIIESAFESIFHKYIWIGFPSLDDYKSISWMSTRVDDVVSYVKSYSVPICITSNPRRVGFVVPEDETYRWKEFLPLSAGSPMTRTDDSKVPTYIVLETESGDEILCPIVILNDSRIRYELERGDLSLYDGIRQTSGTVKVKSFLAVDMRKMKDGRDDSKGAERNIREWRRKLRLNMINAVSRAIGKLDLVDCFSESVLRLSIANPDNQPLVEKEKNIAQGYYTETDIEIFLGFLLSITRSNKDYSFSVKSRSLEKPPYRSSVFIDEAQDFSELQVYLLSMLSNPKYSSVTAVGDAAQSLQRLPRDLSENFPKRIYPSVHNTFLPVNIRQSLNPALSNLSDTFRAKFIDRTIRDTSISKCSAGEISAFNCLNSADNSRKSFEIIKDLPKKDSIVIVAPTQKKAKRITRDLKPYLWKELHLKCNYSETIDLSKKYMIHITTPSHVKGLEFDHVIALSLDHYDLKDTRYLHECYVLLSRPMMSLSLCGKFSDIDANFIDLLNDFLPESMEISHGTH